MALGDAMDRAIDSNSITRQIHKRIESDKFMLQSMKEVKSLP